MFGSELIEVIIGVLALYILLSIVCSAAREAIESLQKSRAVYLLSSMSELLNNDTDSGAGSDVPRSETNSGDNDLKTAFYSHPMIYSLFPDGYRDELLKSVPNKLWGCGSKYPSYISSRNFAIAMLDIAARGKADADNDVAEATPVLSLQVARDNVNNIVNIRLRRALLIAIDMSDGDIKKAIRNLENWYDGIMERVCGQYKRHTAMYIFVLAMIFTVSLDLDTISIAKTLYSQEMSATNPLPIGWSSQNQALAYLMKFLGWLLTAFAASLGAPFWFDLLGKVVQLRAAIPPKNLTAESLIDEGVAASQTEPGAEGVVARIDESDDWQMDMSAITKDEDLPMAEGGVA